jgi:prevent-host-death family protein
MMTNMVIRGNRTVVGVAEAKAKLSELLERVSRGERIVVAKRGKPVAVLAPPEAVSDDVAHPRGLASLAGVLADWPSLERDLNQVIEARRTARDRGVPDLE